MPDAGAGSGPPRPWAPGAPSWRPITSRRRPGLAVLAAGGHAVDAAIATNAVLGVVMPNGCGIGGDAFWLVWDEAAGEQVALNGSGRSPAGMDAAGLRARGLDRIPLRGPLAITIPGAVRSWADAHRRWGRLSRDAVLAAAIEHAAAGFPAWAGLVERRRGHGREPGPGAVDGRVPQRLAARGTPWRPGELIRLPAPGRDAAHARRRRLRRLLRRRPRRADRRRAAGGRRRCTPSTTCGTTAAPGARRSPPPTGASGSRRTRPTAAACWRSRSSTSWSGSSPRRVPGSPVAAGPTPPGRTSSSRPRSSPSPTVTGCSRTPGSGTSRWSGCSRQSTRRRWPPGSTRPSPTRHRPRPARSWAARSGWASWTPRATPSASSSPTRQASGPASWIPDTGVHFQNRGASFSLDPSHPNVLEPRKRTGPHPAARDAVPRGRAAAVGRRRAPWAATSSPRSTSSSCPRWSTAGRTSRPRSPRRGSRSSRTGGSRRRCASSPTASSPTGVEAGLLERGHRLARRPVRRRPGARACDRAGGRRPGGRRVPGRRDRSPECGAAGGPVSLRDGRRGARTARSGPRRVVSSASRWQPRSHRPAAGPVWTAEAPVTSNVGQNYPYTSETEAVRAARVAELIEGREGLADKLKVRDHRPGPERPLVGVEVPHHGLRRPPPRRGLRHREARGLHGLRRDLREDLPALVPRRAA